ncbi:MBL fold metallo-hydrolase [Corallococcus exiguus]|uniref:ComEC/Rec2 family competence protein n=1 Tax=Corallococcus exiguus TaxID=83462 RepID=UPI001472573B|nr:MBL fold metallo-hydrolase [Corallococcus exiguus]NNC16698.1 MBL fold metallo-hydrolase [Corallococcus exiguus]
MSIYRVHLLPAHHGDCILLEYGLATRPHRVLIDGGTPGTWKHLEPVLQRIPKQERRFDLLVVSHVDADHIGGVLGLFDEGIEGLSFDDIWFNGYRHLKSAEEFGPVQGERLTTHLWQQPSWNKAFGGGAVVVPETGALPVVRLPGGMQLTLLSPTRRELLDLLPKWEQACAKAGLDPQQAPPEEPPAGLELMGSIDVVALAKEKFSEDGSEANGSSIAFVAEFEGRQVLFGADAHPNVLERSILRLPGGRARVDAFKLPHHGSKKNLSPGLLGAVDTSRYLFSTNGSQFRHPDRQTVARILSRQQPCALWFNYRSEYTQAWDENGLREEWQYTPVFPKDGAHGVVLELG